MFWIFFLDRQSSLLSSLFSFDRECVEMLTLRSSVDMRNEYSSQNHQNAAAVDHNGQSGAETAYYPGSNDQTGYYASAAEPVSSYYMDNSTDTARGYNQTYNPQVLTADSGYYASASRSQYDDPIDAPTYGSTPYSSEYVPPAPESYAAVDDSNSHGKKKSRHSRGSHDNGKSRGSHRGHR